MTGILIWHQCAKEKLILISPFLTHTHPHEMPLRLSATAGAILDVSVFFYHLAAVL